MYMDADVQPGWAPWFLFDVRKSGALEKTLFERLYVESNVFLRNPMFKSVFCYNMWFYELNLFGLSLMFFS